MVDDLKESVLPACLVDGLHRLRRIRVAGEEAFKVDDGYEVLLIYPPMVTQNEWKFSRLHRAPMEREML